MKRYGFGLAPLKMEGKSTPYDHSAQHQVEGTERADIDDHITLPGGRKFYANRLIVGIDAEGNTFEGYDGGVSSDEWTEAERRELAELMIERWRKFGALDQPRKPPPVELDPVLNAERN
jgi:hypothetical protein